MPRHARCGPTVLGSGKCSMTWAAGRSPLATLPSTNLNHVQLGDAVLLHGHRQRDPVLLYNHLGVQAFPSVGNGEWGLVSEVP